MMPKEAFMPGADTGHTELNGPPPVALLDADRFMVGETLDSRFPRIDWHQYAAVAELAGTFPGKIIPVTNRPVPVAAQLAETVGAGLAVAESGATYWVCGTTQPHPHYYFEYYRKHVRPEVIKLVTNEIKRQGLQHQVRELEGNLVTACFYPENGGKSQMPALNASVVETLNKEGLGPELRVHADQRLDISPQSLDKRLALHELMGGLFQFVYRRQIPFETLVVGDDSRSAIGLMKDAFDMSRGQAQLITVANADPQLKSFVTQHHGYVSPFPFAQGVKDGLHYALERFGVQKTPGTWRVAAPAVK